MFQSKCLLLVVLLGPKLGIAVRSAAIELDAASADIDHLKVLYKYCFASALKQAASDTTPQYPLIVKDGDSDKEFDTIRGHWKLLRMSHISCPIELTDKPEDQHDIPFSEIQDNFKDASGQALYDAYTRRPKKAWFELGAGEEVNNAVKELYKSAMRSKSSFYIYDWQISGECGSSASGEWKHERCHEVMSGAVKDGQVKFQANLGGLRGEAVHIDNEGTEILNKATVFDAAFIESCKNTLKKVDSKYEGISSELCSGQKFYKCGEENPSVDTCSSGTVSNVGWNDGGFYWK